MKAHFELGNHLRKHNSVEFVSTVRNKFKRGHVELGNFYIRKNDNIEYICAKIAT